MVVSLVALMGSCTFVGGLLGLNQITVDGDSYELSQLALEYYGSNGDGSYDVDVNIFSEGIDWDSGGSGDWVYIDLNSPSSSFGDGTYTWSTVREDYSIVAGAVILGMNTSSETVDQVIELTDGELTLRMGLNGDHIIRFEFDGTDVQSSSAVDVTGHFRGPVDEEEPYYTIMNKQGMLQLLELNITPQE